MNERPGTVPASDGPTGGWSRLDRSAEEGPGAEVSASEDPTHADVSGERTPGEGSAGSTGRHRDTSSADPGGSKELVDDWRRSALEEFRQWLEEVPDTPPRDGEESDECDLRDLFGELAALRQEIRLQNREQSKASRALANAAAGYEAARLAGERRDEDLADLERRVSRAAEDRVLRSTLEVRDALARGREAARRLRDRPGLAWLSSRRIAGVAEGYEQALRRFDRMLAGFGVRIVPAVGEPFDSRTMHAVVSRPDERAGDGVVVEELRSGFTREGEVLRLADVAVSRHDGRR